LATSAFGHDIVGRIDVDAGRHYRHPDDAIEAFFEGRADDDVGVGVDLLADAAGGFVDLVKSEVLAAGDRETAEVAICFACGCSSSFGLPPPPRSRRGPDYANDSLAAGTHVDQAGDRAWPLRRARLARFITPPCASPPTDS
jgi:hypothetical protein